MFTIVNASCGYFLINISFLNNFISENNLCKKIFKKTKGHFFRQNVLQLKNDLIKIENFRFRSLWERERERVDVYFSLLPQKIIQ